MAAHDAVGAIAADGPARGHDLLTGLAFIRDPNNEPQANVGPPFMPLSMGDSGFAFLSVTFTQYFCLVQWNDGRFEAGPGRRLARASGSTRRCSRTASAGASRPASR